MRIVYYKATNRPQHYCERCGRRGVRTVAVRWVSTLPYLSWVAGHNVDEAVYCSVACLRQGEENPDLVVRVRYNTIEEINAMGLPA